MLVIVSFTKTKPVQNSGSDFTAGEPGANIEDRSSPDCSMVFFLVFSHSPFSLVRAVD